MNHPVTAVVRIALVCAAFFLAASRPALAQDPEPPIMSRWEADITLGALPFTPGQTYSFAVPKTIPNSTNSILVAATFTCSLISGSVQGGMQITWTIWTPIQLFNGTPSKASLQNLLWCAPGQLTTNQAIEWLPITSPSRSVFVRLDTTGTIPWDKTQSEVKIVSYNRRKASHSGASDGVLERLVRRFEIEVVALADAVFDVDDVV